jgi:hypothetical protein
MCGGHGQGCIVAPSLSIGAVLLQQAAAAAAFQYNHVEIIESQQGLSVSGPWTCLSAMVMASSDYLLSSETPLNAYNFSAFCVAPGIPVATSHAAC